MATTNIVDKDGNTIAASDATVPSDRHFRNAWTLSGKTITEDVKIDSDGYYTSDTNPYVLRYIKPKTKKALFNHWDSVGKPDWSALKLFGVEEDVDEGSSDFRNVSDVLYPLLVIEWLGGIENTPLAKEDWMDMLQEYFNMNMIIWKVLCSLRET